MPNNHYRHVTDVHPEPLINGHSVPDIKPQSPYELRSEEVQDIMTRMPSWIIRHGTTVLFLVIALLFTGAYFIHFPEIITAPVNIKSSNATTTIAEESKEPKKYLAIATVPVEKAAKIKSGQQVLIKLPLYPFRQSGMVQGSIEAVLASDAGTSYSIKIHLTNGLATAANKKINDSISLYGTAQIITDDKTILQRMFEVFRKR